MTTLPQWSTPERRQQLVALFHKYGNQCLEGHDVCPELTHYVEWGPMLVKRYTQRCSGADDGSHSNPYVEAWTHQHVTVNAPYLARLYNKVAESAIESWKAEDRERRSVEWKLEQQAILDGTYGGYGTQFDPVARDVFVSERPEYYLVGIGVNPFTYKRVALVRIPSTFVHLFVDVGGVVQEVSKNARRKAMRHGKYGTLMPQIDHLCKLAVADWWAARN